MCSASPRGFESLHVKSTALPLDIINFEKIVYHQNFSFVYHHCERLYILKADDIQLLSQWIKKQVFRLGFLAESMGFDGLCPSFATQTPDYVRLRRGGSNPYLFQ